MSHALIVRPEAEVDIAKSFAWYESELSGLGVQFLDSLDDAFERISSNPLHYADIAGGIRRKLLRKFPYGVFFVFEDGLEACCGSRKPRFNWHGLVDEWACLAHDLRDLLRSILIRDESFAPVARPAKP